MGVVEAAEWSNAELSPFLHPGHWVNRLTAPRAASGNMRTNSSAALPTQESVQWFLK